MANAEHLKILKEGVESVENRKTRAKLAKYKITIT